MEIKKVKERLFLSLQLGDYISDSYVVNEIHRVYGKCHGLSETTTMLRCMDETTRKAFLELHRWYTTYHSKREEFQEKSEALERILFERKHWEFFKTAVNAGCEEKYVAALMGARRSGQEEEFLTLEKDRLLSGLWRHDESTLIFIFEHMHCFEDKSFFLHTLKHPIWYSRYKNMSWETDGVEDVLMMLQSSEARIRGFFFSTMSPSELRETASVWKKNPEVVSFIDGLLAFEPPVFMWLNFSKLFKVKDFQKTGTYLTEIAACLKTGAYCLTNLLVQTNFHCDVLKRLAKVLPSMDKKQQAEFLEQSPLYVCLELYGCGKLLELLKSERYEIERCEILLSSLLERKNRFLSLVESGQMDSALLIFANNLFCKAGAFVSFNEFTMPQWKKLEEGGVIVGWNKKQVEYVGSFDRLFNFQELLLLDQLVNYNTTESIELFFGLLEKLKRDDAVIRTKQLIGSLGLISQHHVASLVSALAKRDLPEWKRRLFHFDISLSLVAKYLTVRSDVLDSVVVDAENEVEVKFLLRNPELCEQGLRKGIEKFYLEDIQVKELKDKLAMPEEFYKENLAAAKDFFMRGNVDIALTYLNSLVGHATQREKFRKVLLAAISGKLFSVRFSENDLEKECGITLSQKCQEVWKTDLESQVGQYHLFEDSSFEGIMSMGVEPKSTCMAYTGGSYCECLLSYFDANKSIIYIEKDGKKVARAVLRLTKMTFDDRAMQAGLDFIDVTSDSNVIHEQPTLFLERMYTPRQGEQERHLEYLMIDFAKKKATEAEVNLVISCDYDSYLCSAETDYTLKKVGIYITRSKAGCQYLDSFGGKHFTGGESWMAEDIFLFSDCWVSKELCTIG